MGVGRWLDKPRPAEALARLARASVAARLGPVNQIRGIIGWSYSSDLSSWMRLEHPKWLDLTETGPRRQSRGRLSRLQGPTPAARHSACCWRTNPPTAVHTFPDWP